MKPNGYVKKVVVVNEAGIHARPAAAISKLAKEARSKVWIEKNGQRANAGIITEILGLYCPRGAKMVLGAEHSEDSGVVEKIAKLIKNGFAA